MALSPRVLENEIKLRRHCARVWVREAYRMACAMQPDITISVKTDAYGRPTFLTKTDKKIEKFLVAKIKKHFPQDAIIGEEGANVPVTEGCFCWILDPIDGTDNFACRISPWAISVGVMYEGMPVVAVVAVHDPALPYHRRVLSTQRGSSQVLCGRQPLRAYSARRPPGRWIIGVEGLKKITGDVQRAKWVEAMVQRMAMLPPSDAPDVFRSDLEEQAQGLFGGQQIAKKIWAFAYQPRTLSSFIGQSIFNLLGHTDGHIEGYCGLWDIVAIDLLARNAGFMCTRWDGTPVFPHAWNVAMNDLPAYRRNYGQFDIIVAPAEVHSRLLEILGPYAGEVERDAAKKLAEQKAKK